MASGIQKKWDIAPILPNDINERLADFSPVFRQVLFNRGVTSMPEAMAFLHPESGAEHDPFSLMGMSDAVEKVLQVISAGGRIAVYGDYDVDGVTSTALLVEVLRSLGVDAFGYIPNRFDEGYGLHPEAMHNLHERGVKLVITVDCGIRSAPEVRYAQDLGMDVIVTDHHTPLGALPPCMVICQKQEGETYPFRDLAGVGLAYKLAAGVFEQHPVEGVGTEDWLDLVALGSIADMVPLLGENRALVKRGLLKMREGKRLGLRALCGVARIDIRQVTSAQIGFTLGPRMNAAGRLDTALAAFNLLLEKDDGRAAELAQQLDDQNRDRQVLTQSIQQSAESEVGQTPSDLILFYFDTEENIPRMSGVVGLAAARLMESHYRPAIVGCRSAETTRASCRSIPEFHITDALDACADLLVHHGGHAAAAGFTVQNEKLDLLMERLKGYAGAKLGAIELTPKLKIDAEVPLPLLNRQLLDEMAALEPTGMGNPVPVFMTRGLKPVRYRTVGSESQHLKITLSDGSLTYDAIAFRQAHWMTHMPQRIDVAFNFEMNEFNGIQSFQLNIRDIRDADSATISS